MAYFNEESQTLCDGCGSLRFGTSGQGHYGSGFSWAPRWSGQYVPCDGCGGPTDPMPSPSGWEAPCDGLCAPHHSLGCGHSPSDPGFYGLPEGAK